MNDFQNGYGIDGNQWTDPNIMDRVAGGYRVGGQWRHFVQYDPYGHGCHEHDRHGHSHGQHFTRQYPNLSERQMSLFNSSIHQLENLKKITKEKEMYKLVYLDVMSLIFGTNQVLTIGGGVKVIEYIKELKESVMMLRLYGFTVRLIIRGIPSGDNEYDNIVRNLLYELGGLTTYQSYVDEQGNGQSLSDARIISLIKEDEDVPFTKVYYMGNTLHSTGLANGLLRPVLITTSDALYIEKNVADFVTVSGVMNGQHIKELACALLYAHDINPLGYLSKGRRLSLRGDVNANFIHKLGNNILFADNSVFVNDYLVKLETKYGVERSKIYSTISHVRTDGNLNSPNDIYISTVLKYFLDNFGSLKMNRCFFMNVFKGNVVPDDNTMVLLKQLNTLYVPELEWTILVSEFDQPSIETYIIKPLREAKLYNILSMLNITDTTFKDEFF